MYLKTDISDQGGARVNTKDNRWLTPLHRACASKAFTVVEVLLGHQVKVQFPIEDPAFGPGRREREGQVLEDPVPRGSCSRGRRMCGAA